MSFKSLLTPFGIIFTSELIISNICKSSEHWWIFMKLEFFQYSILSVKWNTFNWERKESNHKITQQPNLPIILNFYYPPSFRKLEVPLIISFLLLKFAVSGRVGKGKLIVGSLILTLYPANPKVVGHWGLNPICQRRQGAQRRIIRGLTIFYYSVHLQRQPKIKCCGLTESASYCLLWDGNTKKKHW